MVSGLGKYSYLAMAFTGAFELVRQKIDNDWGLAVQKYIDNASEYAEYKNKMNEEISRIRAELEAERKKNDEAINILHDNNEIP
ncbi:MAG: hypothetical protein VB084_14535 [Syntrophomonadaceae bacterium]|nr:hypothetical protein [Syntrophomonadaceae bacterium]